MRSVVRDRSGCCPDRETPLYASLSGPFRAEEQAEHERDEQQAAWDRALEEWDGENPYEFKGWDITKQYLSEFQISQLDRQDEEPHRITRDAVNAVGASLLADEGIGPLAGEHND
jgi:hypothetical protein